MTRLVPYNPPDAEPVYNVDQSNAHAKENIIGRDYIKQDNRSFHHTTILKDAAPRASRIIEQLLDRLSEEVRTNQEIRHTVERLQRYYIQRAHDGINGLENKLKASRRESSYIDAIEMKEMFVKTLER